MTPDEVINLMTKLEMRLVNLTDHAEETCRQAQHTLQRIELLRRDLERLKEDILTKEDTSIL
jgi:hypothetical protein